MRAPTSGWIGMGFSENGSMKNADIFVGWVKDGKATITVGKVLIKVYLKKFEEKRLSIKTFRFALH